MTKKSSKYPSAAAIKAIFDHMETGEYDKMFQYVSEDVDWTVMGTHPLAGRYRSRSDFQNGTLARLAGIMKEPGLKLKVRQVIGGGDEPWAVVELIADAVCKNGEYSVFQVESGCRHQIQWEKQSFQLTMYKTSSLRTHMLGLCDSMRRVSLSK
jgi:ketosteroid isomerase-like protein